MSERTVELYDDADAVAEVVAERLRRRLSEIQQDGRVPQLALTGGRIASRAYQRLGAAAGAEVDWSRVDLWWSDERFVPADDGDRNAGQAMAAFGDGLPFDPARIHQMPASDEDADLDAAATAYAAELGSTRFDICLLGMGPDGHVASLFPDHPDANASGSVIAVRSSPKPPPERLSVTFAVLNASTEVWFCVSGEDKAEALARTFSVAPSEEEPLPAARVAGTDLTLWLIDRAAATHLP